VYELPALIFRSLYQDKEQNEFEKVVLGGVRDELWAGFYAAYVLGKLSNLKRPSVLSGFLESVPDSENWSKSAAEFVLSKLPK